MNSGGVFRRRTNWHVMACGPNDQSSRCVKFKITTVSSTSATTNYSLAPGIEEGVDLEINATHFPIDFEEEQAQEEISGIEMIFSGNDSVATAPVTMGKAGDADTPPGKADHSAFAVIAMVFVFSAAFLFNSLILGLFMKKRKLRQHSNFFIFSLSLADLGVTTTVLPFSIATYTHGSAWIFGPHLCRIWIFLDYFWCTLSVICLVFIALDRLEAVSNPFEYTKKKDGHHLHFTLAFAWFLSFLLTFPTVLTFLLDFHLLEFSTCALMYSGSPMFVAYTAVVSYFLPLFALIVLYYLIYMKTKVTLDKKLAGGSLSTPTYIMTPERHSLAAAAEFVGTATTSSTRTSSSSGSGNKQQLVIGGHPHVVTGGGNGARPKVEKNLHSACLERKLAHLLSRERRLLKIIIYVVVSFVVCWTPFWMVYVITPFCDGDKEWCRYIANARWLHLYTQWLGYSNSLVNPILYTIFNQDFKKAVFKVVIDLKKILTCTYEG